MSDTGTSYKRVLLKLSGEVLKGNADTGIEAAAVEKLAARLGAIRREDLQLALVIGAGNIFRGLAASEAGMKRNTADQMGMMATIINALAVQDALEATGIRVRIQTPYPLPGVGDPFDARRAGDHLTDGTVLIFAGGTGHPYFTTDTTAALRACEIGADAILKATKVNGVYSDDPAVNTQAVRYRTLSYDDALRQRLKVMDSTAFSLCMDNDIPIVVFNYADPASLHNVLQGNMTAATLVGYEATATARD